MKGITLTLASFAAASFLAAACTVHQTEAPALSGPSESATALNLTASPDSISQDGRSTSTVALVARDANGHGLANASFRVDIVADGQPVDYGSLSSRNITTGTDGRASVVYTAPPAPPVGSDVGVCSGSSASAVLAGRCVQIVATSVGTDFTTAASRGVEIHLIATGVISPPASTPVAAFTVTPASPKAAEAVLFDASKSCAGALDASGKCPASAGTIASYAWSFGDGTTGSGQGTSHAYSLERSYLATLTVTNDKGVSASTSQSITVGAGSLPTPAFTFSPAAPSPSQDIFFDASTSKPGSGHYLTRFVWNWGDGSAFGDSSSPSASHRYTAAGSYQVTLTVSDESGQSASLPETVAVGGSTTAPTAKYVYSPTAVTPGQTINFDATQSTAAVGRHIVQYRWNWGDGSSNSSVSTAQTTHVFTTAGAYQVVLTVVDDLSQTSQADVQTITVGVAPKADFVFSPTNPLVGTIVNFDASTSSAGAGHTIVQYQWNWGDGSALATSASPLGSHPYTGAFTYTVTLTVTDERGQTAVKTATLTVAP